MTRQQDWARQAHAAVFHMKGQEGESEYRTFCMKGPALIQRAGVLQALAFLLSRNDKNKKEAPKDQSKKTGKQYAEDLCLVYGQGDPENFLDYICSESCGLTEYIAITRDLIHVATWFRRFAQIELEGSQD